MTTLAFALRARTFRSLRRHRNYRIFFTGQVVSLAGTWMQNVALAWLVIELSGSPLAIGALAFCRFVPFTLFGLVAGVVADRIESRKLVMVTQAAAMAISIALAVVTLTGTATLGIVYALAAIGGKWKMIIIYWLAEEPAHFAGLHRKMESISRKVLTQQLRELSADGIVDRCPASRSRSARLNQTRFLPRRYAGIRS